MTRISKLALAVALMAALAIVAVGCGGQREESTSEAQQDRQDTGGTSESTAAGGDTDVGVGDGQIPPHFELPDLDGNTVTLSDYEGKVVVLDLWATWCGPCRVEVPFLVSLYEEFKDEGLVVVGVGLDPGGAEVLRPFVESNGVTYPILVGNRAVQTRFGVSGIPTTFMIGRDGRIASKHVGFHPSMSDGMKSEVVELLAAAAPEA